MMNQAIMAFGVIFAGIHTTEATREEITVEADDITFAITRYDDGRGNPYELVFDTDGVSSLFMFHTTGYVTDMKVGTETYEVLYDSSLDLKKVTLTSSSRRHLFEEGVIKNGNEEEVIAEHRRLYSCDDCVEAWDAICDEGVPTVCDLIGYGSPILPAAGASIVTVCDTFGSACSSSGGSETCAGQCEEDKDGEIDGVNACLDSTSDGYKCTLTGNFGNLDLEDCNLVDADFADLSLCFDTVGRENIGLVNLDNNQLTTLTGDLLSGLTDLGDFYMRGNQLASISKEAFSTQTSQLDQLWLSNNALTTLPADLWIGLKGVFSLGLDGNPDLQCVPPFGQTVYEVYVDSDDMLTGTCECEPIEAVMCEKESSCKAGTEGYTCE